MLPISDGLRARNFPFVNTALIVANFAVWIFYELPHLNSSIYHASFYACAVDNSYHAPEPWGISWIAAMFMHGSWDHILGNMLFLFIFGKNVDDAFGPLRYLAFYFAGGFIAMMTQTAMTLWFGTAADGRVPNLGVDRLPHDFIQGRQRQLTGCRTRRLRSMCRCRLPGRGLWVRLPQQGLGP